MYFYCAYARLSCHFVEQILNAIVIVSSLIYAWTVSWTAKAIERIEQIFIILYRYENIFFMIRSYRIYSQWCIVHILSKKKLYVQSMISILRISIFFFLLLHLSSLSIHSMTIWDNYFPFFFSLTVRPWRFGSCVTSCCDRYWWCIHPIIVLSKW